MVLQGVTPYSVLRVVDRKQEMGCMKKEREMGYVTESKLSLDRNANTKI